MNPESKIGSSNLVHALDMGQPDDAIAPVDPTVKASDSGCYKLVAFLYEIK
jgi:hypothetical protein